MTKGINMREQDLDDLFAEARRQTSLDSGLLMARILEDAAALQPKQAVSLQRRSAPVKLGFWSQVALALGGKGVLAGLGTAAAAGVMLGFVQPASITSVTDLLFTQTPLDQVDLLPGIDAILTEG